VIARLLERHRDVLGIRNELVVLIHASISPRLDFYEIFRGELACSRKRWRFELDIHWRIQGRKAAYERGTYRRSFGSWFSP
jgi:hypothetical protein